MYDPLIEAFGTVDEASSALGLARALTPHARVTSICEELQRGLYAVGAELGTNPEADKAFVVTGPPQIQRLEQLISELESEAVMPQGFILPGATPASGALTWGGRSPVAPDAHALPRERAGGL